MSRSTRLLPLFHLCYTLLNRPALPPPPPPGDAEEEPADDETPLVLPRMLIYLDDDTEYWDPQLVKRAGGRILSAHFFDACRRVHICEFTPSYELYFLESYMPDYPAFRSSYRRSAKQNAAAEYRWEARRDALQEEIRDADRDTPWVGYRHVQDVNLEKCIEVWAVTAEEWRTFVEDAGDDEEQATNALVEATREHIQSHGYY